MTLLLGTLANNGQITGGGPFTYNNSITTYYEGQRINSYCNEITFYNQGTTLLIVNLALKLYPGQSVAFDGKQFEEDTTIYNIDFDASIVVAPVVAVNDCVVFRKYYNS